MKVDFTKFPLFTGIDRQDMVIADIRKDIADGIYRNVPGLPAHVLAEKIYRNELVELADDEIHILDLYTSASVGQLADSWQDYKKTIWKLVNKNIMEKMELSEALKANASVLEGLLGVSSSTIFKGKGYIQLETEDDIDKVYEPGVYAIKGTSYNDQTLLVFSHNLGQSTVQFRTNNYGGFLVF